MTENIFESATRGKYRFSSNVGELTVEQLWDLTDVKLEQIAIAIDDKLSQTTKTFRSKITGKKKEQTLLENKLEILKHIIAVKEAEEEERLNEKAVAQKKQTLLAALDRKQSENIDKLSEAEILEQLKQL